jgi:hypothetical protein
MQIPLFNLCPVKVDFLSIAWLLMPPPPLIHGLLDQATVVSSLDVESE